MINIVTALSCEARPLLDHYGLVLQRGIGGFSVYEKDDVRLVVSGVGRLLAAAATGFLAALATEETGQDEVFINIGVGGARDLEMGEQRLATIVRDGVTGFKFYPVFATTIDLPRGPLLTLDSPGLPRETGEVCDMEAAAFCGIAQRFTTAEFIHCYKVVSDNETFAANRMTPVQVTSLIEARMLEIELLVGALRSLSSQGVGRQGKFAPEELPWRANFNETRQLERLIARRDALVDPEKNEGIVWSTFRSAREALEALQEEVDRLAKYYTWTTES